MTNEELQKENAQLRDIVSNLKHDVILNRVSSFEMFVKDKFSNIEKMIDELRGGIIADIKDHEERIKKLEEINATCPIKEVKNEFDAIKKKITPVTFFIDNPLLFKYIVVGFLTISLANLAILVYLNFIK